MSHKIDITNQKFNRLTAIKEYGSDKNGRTLWLCNCDCGNKDIIVSGKLLRNGNTKSCGCLQQENRLTAKKKYNTYDLTGEYGIGYTFNNGEFYFDLEDYDKIKEYCWYIRNKYILTMSNKKHLSMHRLVLDIQNSCGNDVDHINHNKNDNRKINLRITTRSQNKMNVGLIKTNTSGVTGVCWDKKYNKWMAYIKLNQKHIYLGHFVIFEDAVNTRKEAEEKYFGKYSFSNSLKLNEDMGGNYNDIQQ